MADRNRAGEGSKTTFYIRFICIMYGPQLPYLRPAISVIVLASRALLLSICYDRHHFSTSHTFFNIILFNIINKQNTLRLQTKIMVSYYYIKSISVSCNNKTRLRGIINKIAYDTQSHS